jgi:hypothetical protein
MSDMKVKVQNSMSPGLKTVTFEHGDRAYVYLMEEELAKALEIRLNAMWQFKHGILKDGGLIAMFKDPADRNEAHRQLAIHVDSEYERFDARR